MSTSQTTVDPAMIERMAAMRAKRGRGPGKRKMTLVQELEAQAVTPAWLAGKLIYVAEHGKPKERLEALDRIMALRGDIKDKNSGAAVTINTGPVMQIVGMSQERIKALRGAIPQLSPERAEEERAARANARLAELKRGNQPDIATHSKARADEPVMVESGNAELYREAETGEGRHPGLQE